MISHMLYDAKNKKQRKEVLKGNVVCISIVWGILMFLSLLTSLLIYTLTTEQNDQVMVTLSCLFHLSCMSTGVVLFLALLLFPTMGRQSICVDFDDEYFSIKTSGPFENAVYQIYFCDVEKIYVSQLSKLGIWQKYVGHYQVYFRVKKDTRNGLLHNYTKPVLRQLPPVYSLENADKIVAFFECRKAECQNISTTKHTDNVE